MAVVPVDLFGVLRAKMGRRGTAKAYIELTRAPGTVLVADPDTLGEPIAAAIAAQIRDAMLAGRAPDGSVLPRVAASTVRRREYRDRQFAGQARQRGKKVAFVRHRMRRMMALPGVAKTERQQYRLKLRYRALRLGLFDPRAFDNVSFGRESGMLAKSITVTSEAPGRWHLFVADNRSRIDRKTGESAAGRVFGRLRLATHRAVGAPAVQRAIAETRRRVAQPTMGAALALIGRAMRILAGLLGG